MGHLEAILSVRTYGEAPDYHLLTLFQKFFDGNCAEKADALAVLLLGHGQVKLFCERSNPFFLIFPTGKTVAARMSFGTAQRK